MRCSQHSIECCTDDDKTCPLSFKCLFEIRSDKKSISSNLRRILEILVINTVTEERGYLDDLIQFLNLDKKENQE